MTTVVAGKDGLAFQSNILSSNVSPSVKYNNHLLRGYDVKEQLCLWPNVWVMCWSWWQSPPLVFMDSSVCQRWGINSSCVPVFSQHFQCEKQLFLEYCLALTQQMPDTIPLQIGVGKYFFKAFFWRDLKREIQVAQSGCGQNVTWRGPSLVDDSVTLWWKAFFPQLSMDADDSKWNLTPCLVIICSFISPPNCKLLDSRGYIFSTFCFPCSTLQIAGTQCLINKRRHLPSSDLHRERMERGRENSPKT